MAASCPATSGATRTSVVRTTPTIGGGSGRQSKYAPMPAASTMIPSAMKVADLRLRMHAPPLGDKRGNHRKREVGDGKNPKAAPVVQHLPQARTQLIDAHEAVDRQVRRKYVAHGLHRLGNCLARPGKAGQEKLRDT